MRGFSRLSREGARSYSLRRSRRVKLLIRKDWEREELLEVITLEAERLQKNPACERVPTGKSSLVFKMKVPKGELYLKHFRDSGWINRAKALVLGTRAEKSWRGGNLLRSMGFTTPPLVGMGTSSSLFGRPLDFLVTEAVRGPRLKQLLKDEPEKQLAAKGWRKGAFLEMLALTIAELHRRGVYHGDLNPTNILVNLEGDLGLSTFCFLDNARCQLMKRVPYALRVKDLSGLNNPRLPCISTRDRLRFFSVYRKSLGVHDPKAMVQHIWQRSIRPRKRHRSSS